MKSSKRIQNLKPLHSTALSEVRKRDFEMPEMQMPGGPELLSGGGDHPSRATTAPPRPPSPRRKPVNMVDLNLNDDPPESDGEDGMLLPPTPVDPSTRSNMDESPSVKSTVSVKDPDLVENEEIDQQCHGASMSREEKVCSLKAGLVHVARKVPKNAHAHYILGLMYQRLGQPQKAILAYEKSAEILLQDEDDVRRPDLLAIVRIHHSQCILQATTGDSLDKELDTRELGEILAKLDTSMQADVKQASVWNTLGAILLKMGQLKSAISVFSSILSFSPDHLDSMANLGVAFLQSGKLELALQCFQDLVLRDQNHPAALLNYATCLLYKLGSITAETGPGAFAGEGANSDQVEGINVAKECLLAAVKAEPKSAQLWVNLANACYLAGEHTNAKSCLEQAAKLEPNQMAVRYAIATHRIREAERAQESTDQLVWAANEMATLIKEGDPALIDIPTAWSGFAMAHKAQHEIGATYESKQMDLDDIEERAVCTLKQTINEDSDDAVHWHQLGLHNLRTMQFKPSVKFFKSSLVRCLDCSYTWSNLGVAFHLSHDAPSAETVYKRALSLSKNNQTHAILSNLGNLYREQRKLELAKRILSKSLELTPGYAPANNNLGLVCVAQGQWEEAIGYFKKALESDPLLDCAQSNLAKAVALSTSHGTTGN